MQEGKEAPTLPMMLERANLPANTKEQIGGAVMEEFGLGILQKMNEEELKKFLERTGLKPGHSARLRRALATEAVPAEEGVKSHTPEQLKVVEYFDNDNDRIKFAIEKGKLIKHVNGKRKVGKDDNTGVVTKLYFAPPRDVRDQFGWGGIVPAEKFSELVEIANLARVPHYLPPRVLEFYDGDNDLIKFLIEGGKLFKYVNGNRRVGDGKNAYAGQVSILTIKTRSFERQESRVEDQCGWGGTCCEDDVAQVSKMAKACGVQVHHR